MNNKKPIRKAKVVSLGISLGSALFAKTKSIFRERHAIFLENVTLLCSADPNVMSLFSDYDVILHGLQMLERVL